MLPLRDALAIAAVPVLDELGDRLAGGIGVALAVRRRLLVEAGAERGAGAGQHDHLHVRIGVGLVEGAMQLGLEIARERVHAIRPVERDGRDLVATL